MTEQEIIYSLWEVIRDNAVSDDDKITEGFLRNLLYVYRADAIKDEYEISEEMYQSVSLFFSETISGNGIFESLNLPDILYNRSRAGINLIDMYGQEVPVVSKEEAVITQKSRFWAPFYVAYMQSPSLIIRANLLKLTHADAMINDLLNTLRSRHPIVKVSCILNNPTDAENYDWKKTPFPFPGQKIAELKQKLLRREFSIMSEVKKDQIQNARADNVIYQDESKLYK